MIVKLLTEQHLEFLRLKGGCTGSSTFVKMLLCWKSHAMAQFCCCDYNLIPVDPTLLYMYDTLSVFFYRTHTNGHYC